MAASAQTRVLLADDEPLVRAGLAMLIASDRDLLVVGQANDGIEALRMAATLAPDVVVMDVRMPRLDGVEATRRLIGDEYIVGSDFAAAVLVLTTFNDDRAVYEALRAGASGFLLKSAAPRALGDAIRAVAAGDAWLDPAVARTLLADFAARPDPMLPPPAELDRLTIREKEVLILVAHALSNRAIAEHLMVSEATVKTHVSRIMSKLCLRDRAQAVALAYKTGFVSPTDHPPARQHRLPGPERQGR